MKGRNALQLAGGDAIHNVLQEFRFVRFHAHEGCPMKKLSTIILGVAAMLLVASAALAFTKYPNATCPDTLSILRLKTLLNTVGACNPQTPVSGSAPGDTVLGVGGIVTGFDENPTGFDAYIQMHQGGPNSGIDVFWHGTNFRAPYGLNRGDSLVVEFAGVGQ